MSMIARSSFATPLTPQWESVSDVRPNLGRNRESRIRTIVGKPGTDRAYAQARVNHDPNGEA